MSIQTGTRKSAAAPMQTAPGNGKTRALVVDSVPAMLEAICFLLEHENLVEVVGRALDGVEALRAAAELKPDLILMDIRMPRMNDFEAAAVLTGAVPNSKVVLMSGEDSPELYTNALASGADGLVFKLQFPEEFVSVLGKLFPGYEGN